MITKKHPLTKKLNELKKKYLETKHNHDEILKTEKRIQSKILKENVFLDENMKRITDQSEDFLITDFETYCKKVHNARQKEDYNLDTDFNITFDYKSLENYINAEKELLEMHDKILEYNKIKLIPKKILEKMKITPKYKEIMIDLILKLDLNK